MIEYLLLDSADNVVFYVPEENMHATNSCCSATINNSKNGDYLKKIIPKRLHGQRPHNHCCDVMAAILDDARIPLFYSPIVRKYYMARMDKYIIKGYLVFIYCPWCMTKLPKELTSTYCDIIQKEFGLNPQHIDLEIEDKISEEFKSDEWWKNRGL